jgi:membrane associated rhomboid family serine protease
VIPLRDVIPSRTTPYVTVTIIILNAIAWFYELSMPDRMLNRFLFLYGIVPAAYSNATLITSMFLHGSWSHVIGNMWYLWIFGDNVEDRVGHGRFLIFYLLCGAAAGLGQVMMDPTSTLPTVGASGGSGSRYVVRATAPSVPAACASRPTPAPVSSSSGRSVAS